jgi:uncharacterized protein involved in cysteine biosynthesis
MAETGGLEKQLSKLNTNLEDSLKKNRYFIYSSRPFKFVWLNFIAGIFHSIGMAVGTLLVLTVGGFLVARFLSGIDLAEVVSDWLNQVTQQSMIERGGN